MNSLQLGGRLTRDPELKFGKDSGNSYVRFSIAVSRDFKDKETGEVGVDFFNCYAFGKRAEVIEKYFKKGFKIFITGNMRMDMVQKEGHKVCYPKVIVHTIDFADSKENKEKDLEIPVDENVDELKDDEFPF